MSLNLMSNRKRIERLETKLGIEKDNPDMDYWEEINTCVCECLTQEQAGKKFTLPDYLKFAEHIFYRVLNFFKKLCKKVLDARKGIYEDVTKLPHGGLIRGFGWARSKTYPEMILYKTLSEIGSSPAVNFIKDKLFFSCKDIEAQTKKYIYAVEFPNEPKLYYIGAKKFRYW